MQAKTSSTSRVQKHRAKLRKAGMKPVQIWIPDTSSQSFIAECQRQSQVLATADLNDSALLALMEDARQEVSGWE